MQQMTMRAVRGPDGETRHVPTPFTPPAKRVAKKRHVADPIKTNGESAAEELRLLIERIERIDCDIAEMQADRAEVFGEAKGRGYDVKGLRAILALRKQEKHVRDENEAILETYRSALGML